MVWLIASLVSPAPLDAFPWGSASMSRVFCSATASDAARLTAVVVLPTPPFWFAMAMIRPTFAPVEGREVYLRVALIAISGLVGLMFSAGMFHVKHPGRR